MREGSRSVGGNGEVRYAGSRTPWLRIMKDVKW